LIRLTKLVKLAKGFVIAGYLFMIVGLLAFQIWSKIVGTGFVSTSIIYWCVLVGWIFLILNYRWNSSYSLIPAFILYVIAALLVVLGFQDAGEIAMRMGLIGWIVGIIQAFIGHKKRKC